MEALIIITVGDWILTGGKLIRCTEERNITCLQRRGEEMRGQERRGGKHSQEAVMEERPSRERLRGIPGRRDEAVMDDSPQHV